MKKRYWLFAGENYYPKRGMRNFICGSDDKDALLIYAKSEDWFNKHGHSGLWYQIFDSIEGIIIEEDGDTKEMYEYDPHSDYEKTLDQC